MIRLYLYCNLHASQRFTFCYRVFSFDFERTIGLLFRIQGIH
jgi:hypothetical protein